MVRQLVALITTSTLLFLAVPAHATIPDINGTYSGTLTGTESGGVCVPTQAVSETITVNITQSSGIFSGSGSSVFEDGDTSTFTLSNGDIFPDGTFSADISGKENDGTTFSGFLSGTATVSGDSLSLSVNVTDADGCNISLSGTLNRVSGGTLVVNPVITPSSTLTAPLLLNTQIQNLTSNLGTRIGDVLRGASPGLQRTLGGLQYNGSTGLNAGDSPFAFGAWGSYSFADYDNDLISTAFDGHTHSVLAGIDFAPWDRAVAGVALGYENSDVDTTFNLGNQETDGFTVVPYFGYLLTDTWGFDFSFGYSWLSSDQFRTAPGTTTRITSSPDAHRWFGMFNLTGVTTWDNWVLGGRTGFLLAKHTTDSFVESDGTLVAETDSKLGQWSIGGDVAYSFGEWEPFAKVTYQYDYNLTEITVVGGGPQPSNDRDNFLVGAGIRYFNNKGWTGNLEWNRRLGRDNYDEDTFSITLRGEF